MKTSFSLLYLLLVILCCAPLGAQPQKQRRDGSDRPRRAEAVERYFQQLEQQNPQEVKRLRELRRTDPEAFRQEMRSRLERQRGHRMQELEGDDTLQEHVHNVKQASSEETYLRAKSKLREAVSQRYDQSLAARAQALDQLREKLADLEEKHQREKEKRENIIDRQVARLLQESPQKKPAQE